jgi:hypothetical protein
MDRERRAGYERSTRGVDRVRARFDKLSRSRLALLSARMGACHLPGSCASVLSFDERFNHSAAESRKICRPS